MLFTLLIEDTYAFNDHAPEQVGFQHSAGANTNVKRRGAETG